MKYKEWSEFIDSTGIYLSENYKKVLYPLAATKNEFEMKLLRSYINLIQKDMITKLKDENL